MGFIKYADAKIIEVYENNALLEHFPELERRIASIKPIQLDPERFFYLRDRIVSALELWGANSNGDAFPRNELMRKYLTFVGSRVSIDHKDQLIVGIIPDSYYVPSQYENESGKLKAKGDFVENIIALDKKATEQVGRAMGIQNLTDRILGGEIHDTSMGCYAEYTECSICGNLAWNDKDFCEHIDPSNQLKGTKLKTADGEKEVFEVCHDFYFFEDAIIVPLVLGGLAGGKGADTQSKILERIASETPLKAYIIDRMKQAQSTVPPHQTMPNFAEGGPTAPLNDEQDRETSQIGKKDEDVEEGEKQEYRRQKKETNEEEKKIVIHAEDIKDMEPEKAKQISQDAYTQLQELILQGKKIPDAIEMVKSIYETPYRTALVEKGSIKEELKMLQGSFDGLVRNIRKLGS